jgi:hypothetical protein
LTGGGKPDLLRGNFPAPNLIGFYTVRNGSHGFEMRLAPEEGAQQPLGSLAYGRLVVFDSAKMEPV